MIAPVRVVAHPSWAWAYDAAGRQVATYWPDRRWRVATQYEGSEGGSRPPSDEELALLERLRLPPAQGRHFGISDSLRWEPDVPATPRDELYQIDDEYELLLAQERAIDGARDAVSEALDRWLARNDPRLAPGPAHGIAPRAERAAPGPAPAQAPAQAGEDLDD